MDAVKPVSHPLMFGLLGPLDLTRGNRPVALGPAKQRLLLAGLLLRPNQLVSIPDLTAILWGATPPASSVANLRTYVRGLRASLNAEGEPQSRLTTTRGAYQLRVAPDERDVDRFDAAAARGRAALGVGDASRARAELARAVALWRGAPLGDLTLSPPLAAHPARLKERLLLVEEDRAAALLALGAEAETVSRLRVLLEHYPPCGSGPGSNSCSGSTASATSPALSMPTDRPSGRSPSKPASTRRHVSADSTTTSSTTARA